MQLEKTKTVLNKKQKNNPENMVKQMARKQSDDDDATGPQPQDEKDDAIVELYE